MGAHKIFLRSEVEGSTVVPVPAAAFESASAFAAATSDSHTAQEPNWARSAQRKEGKKVSQGIIYGQSICRRFYLFCYHKFYFEVVMPHQKLVLLSSLRRGAYLDNST